MSTDDLVLSEPKYVGNMPSTHREIPARFRPASVCSIDGHCLHANKCFYNLYVKMPNVYYMRYCSDCKKILNDQGELLHHADFIQMLEDSTFKKDEKKILLANFEEINGI